MTGFTGERPERIGPYRVLERLGAGGMSVVYLAEAPDGGHVAVKLMNAQWTGEPEFAVRFEREVEAIGRVAGFCTAPILDSHVNGAHAYIVTEYVPGPTLWEAVRDQGPCPAPGWRPPPSASPSRSPPFTGPESCTATSSPAT